MIFFYKIFNLRRIHKAIVIIKIDFFNAHNIWCNCISIIRDPLGNPLMATTGLKIPNFILIAKGNSIAFTSTVLFN